MEINARASINNKLESAQLLKSSSSQRNCNKDSSAEGARAVAAAESSANLFFISKSLWGE